MFNRRQFLKAGTASALAGATTASLLSSQVQAAVRPNDFKTMVCLFLDGGNDSFNMLAPKSSAEYNAYNASRRSLAIERSALLGITPKGLGANSFGLHPNMQALKNVFDDGDASFIANAGPLVESVSKADIINETARLPVHIGGHNTGSFYWKGDHDNSSNSTKDGIGGRIANEFINDAGLPIGISSGAGYDLFLAHPKQNFYVVNRGGLKRMFDYNVDESSRFNSASSSARRAAVQRLNEMASADSSLLLQHAGDLLSDGLKLHLDIQRLLENVPPLKTQFPRFQVANDLRNAAELISIREQLNMRRQIIYVRMPGYDTHGDQAPAHDEFMRLLSEALAAFNSAMKELGSHDSVVTFTASEFGRTLTNTGDGTNHAWGGNQILMGGGIKGGEIFGSYPVLELDGEEDYNGDGRFIPSTSVTQMGATIAKWFGVPQNRMSTVFPNIVNFRGREDLGYFS